MDTTTLDNALANINTTATTSPDGMVAALADYVNNLPSDATVLDILADGDVQSFKARFSDGDLSLLDRDAEAKVRQQARDKWTTGARNGFTNAKAAHEAISAQLDAEIARHRELPTVAEGLAGSPDTSTRLLARVVDGLEEQAAARFIAERSAADVVRRYQTADESADGPFVRYVERAAAGHYLRLQDDDLATGTRALGDAIRNRKEARVPASLRTAFEALPALLDRIVRAEAKTLPSARSASNLLKRTGR